jgi:hypothetical protein
MLFLVSFQCANTFPTPVLFLRVLLFRVVGLVGLLLGLDHVDQFLEVLRHDRAVLAGTIDVGDVVLVDVVLLHQLGRRGGHLDLVFRDRGLGRRLGVLHILEKNLAVRAGALDLGDVDPVVASKLLRARGGAHLLLLGSLGKPLEVLDRDLVVRRRALEPVRNRDALRFGEVLCRLAREARHLLLLGGLRQLLREVALGGEEGDRGVAVDRLGLHELVDDHREGLRGGGHGSVVGSLSSCC